MVIFHICTHLNSSNVKIYKKINFDKIHFYIGKRPSTRSPNGYFSHLHTAKQPKCENIKEKSIYLINIGQILYMEPPDDSFFLSVDTHTRTIITQRDTKKREKREREKSGKNDQIPQNTRCLYRPRQFL